MKQKIKPILASALVSIMLCSTALAASFPDVDESADYAEAVDYLSDVGIMVGDDLGNINPNKPVTRAEMATIICRLVGESQNLTKHNDFIDVPVEHWANAYINKAVELGIINGYGDKRYGPSDIVTYEQALTMIVRAMGLEDSAKAQGGYPTGYVTVAKNYGCDEGLTLEGMAPLDRWQVAIILNNSFGW